MTRTARGGDQPRRAAGPPAVEPLPVPVVDAHCHLDLLDQPVDDVLAAARAAGVSGVVTIGIDAASSRWAAATAAGRPGVHAAVAVHPNDVVGATEETFAEIAELAGLPQVSAVGETGLDHYRSGPELWAAQDEAFRRHIRIAKSTDKALVVHDRDAHQEVLRILAEEGAPERTVLHCFSGDAELARRCSRLGYAMSFAGNVTFASAGALREAAAVVPPELLLAETDAPFLAPVPFRGRPNGPQLLAVTVRALADIRRQPVDRVAAGVAEVARRVFRLA